MIFNFSKQWDAIFSFKIKTFKFMKLIYNSIFLFLFFILICNNSVAQNSRCHIDDWTALKQLYTNTNGANWNNNNNWNIVTGSAPQAFCDLEMLYGVTLNTNGRVSIINLNDNNLAGSLPPIMDNFEETIIINLSFNNISGLIPTELSSLSALQILDLSNNQLTGSIPSSFAALSPSNGGSLIEMILQFNNLSGCYSSELSVLCPLAYYGGFISSGNNFDAEWYVFCLLGAGACPCQINFDIPSTTTHSVDGAFQAANQVTSSAIVASNVTVTYSAGNRVRLEEGFKANPNTSNSRFAVYNDGCN